MVNNLKKVLNEKNITYDKAAADLGTSARMVNYDVKAESLQSRKMEKWANYLNMKVTDIFKI